MYDKLKVCNKKGELLKQHHHITIDVQFKCDGQVWQTFLQNSDNTNLCRPFVDIEGFKSATDLSFYSDASLSENLGMGAVFQDTGWEWLIRTWLIRSST